MAFKSRRMKRIRYKRRKYKRNRAIARKTPIFKGIGTPFLKKGMYNFVCKGLYILDRNTTTTWRKFM